jgi:YesN/AraC family two-component response regulator
MNKGYIAAHLLEEGEQLTIFSSIIYIASGNATIKNEENKWSPHTLAAGKAEWIQNDTIIHNKTNKLLKVYSIYMEDFSFFRKVSFAIIEPCKITSELDDLLLLQRNTGFHQQCQVQSRLWGLLAKWTDHDHFDELEETITYINAHLHKNITVRELAEKARMTPTSFARAFKKKTDQSPKDF